MRLRDVARLPHRFGVLLLPMVAMALAGCAHLVMLHDPLTANEHNDLGVSYEASGQLELAAREYRRASTLAPHDARPRVNLGNVEATRQRWPRAERCYRRAIRDSATDADALNNLAMALLRQRHGLAEARTLARRAVSLGGERDSIYQTTLDEIESVAR